MATHRILVINTANAEKVNLLPELEKSEFELIYETDIKKAIRLIKFKKIDFIICWNTNSDKQYDILTNNIKETQRLNNLPLITFFKKGDNSDRIHALKQGSQDCFIREINEEELLLKIRNLLLLSKTINIGNHLISEDQLEDSPDIKFMENLTQCINENLSNKNLDLPLLSNKLACSTSTIQKKVKKITGKSVSILINEYRLNQAQLLLENGNKSISEIVDLVGFGGASYFSKCYKAYFGFTPSKKKIE
ncbi:MAG: helix-turn-helix domain-containing protein [Bacteroidia bacterium]